MSNNESFIKDLGIANSINTLREVLKDEPNFVLYPSIQDKACWISEQHAFEITGSEAEVKFLANADPKTVLALLREIDRLNKLIGA